MFFHVHVLRPIFQEIAKVHANWEDRIPPAPPSVEKQVITMQIKTSLASVDDFRPDIRTQTLSASPIPCHSLATSLVSSHFLCFMQHVSVPPHCPPSPRVVHSKLFVRMFAFSWAIQLSLAPSVHIGWVTAAPSAPRGRRGRRGAVCHFWAIMRCSSFRLLQWLSCHTRDEIKVCELKIRKKRKKVKKKSLRHNWRSSRCRRRRKQWCVAPPCGCVSPVCCFSLPRRAVTVILKRLALLICSYFFM